MDLRDAILNNVTWCSTMASAHGVSNRVGEHYWAAEGVVPLYYSNLVTRTEAEGECAQLDRIRALAARPPQPVWSLKDSFARLDGSLLARLGLRVLFDARWHGLPLGEAGPPESGAEFVRVTSADRLEAWERGWQISSPATGMRIFPPSLLEDPAVAFFAATRGGNLVGGAIANRSEGAVGLSNVFELDSERLLTDFARILRRQFPDHPLVGYGPAEEQHRLCAIGFRDLGPLRVWISQPVHQAPKRRL